MGQQAAQRVHRTAQVRLHGAQRKMGLLRDLVVGQAAVEGQRQQLSRQRFDARYEPMSPTVNGANGAYRNRPLAVLAKQITEDFSVRRTTGGDLLQGRAGDWLLQYAPGDWGVVEEAKFRRVYRPFI